MMDEKKEKKLFILLLVVFIVIFITTGYRIIKIMIEREGTENNLVYRNLTKIDYYVSISENDFISGSKIGSGETYISSIADKINMTMKYDYTASEALPLTVKYRVIATLVGIYNQNPTDRYDNPIIWKKEYTIKELEEMVYEEEDVVKIEENFEIDWAKFNEDMINFKDYFSIPTLSKLEVKMIINLEGSNSKFELKEKKEIVASMPLTEQVFSIEADLEDDEEKSIPSKDLSYLQDNQRKLGVFAVLEILASFLIVVTIYKITSLKNVKSFHSIIEELKKEYNDVVVETKNMINTKGLKPIAITSFDEMLNLADSFIAPIMLYEESKLACFYIIKDEVIYMYILKNKPIKHA